jgi:hypothetical protein
MQPPIKYAEEITALLKNTDTATASFALRVATVLLDYRSSVEASASLETARERFETSGSLSPLRTA